MYVLALSPVLGGLITPAGCTKLILKSSILLCCRHCTQYFFPLLCQFFDQMEVSSRGQLPAWQTKVVDECQSPLKTGTMGLGLVCSNDVASSKPNTLGRDVTDDSQTSGMNMGTVMCCGSRKCMTCSHLVQGNTFTSNVTNKTYGVICPGTSLGCSTRSVVYLISCRKCGVQYVGETSQTLRSRFNNHRNHKGTLAPLYIGIVVVGQHRSHTFGKSAFPWQ